MKRIILFTLLFTLVFSLSACSLLNDKDVEGTQQNGSELTTEQGMGEDEPGTDVAQGTTSTEDTDGDEISSSANEKTINVSLYFPTSDNSALIQEERGIQVSNGEILKACILALAEGPKGQGLRTPIPEGTEIIGISIKDEVAVVDFTEEFSSCKWS